MRRKIRKTGRARAVALLLVVALLFGTASGCHGIATGSRDFHDACGDTFGSTPVTFPFYLIGWIALGIGTFPLVIISAPLTAIFYPDDDEYKQDRVYGHLSPPLIGSAIGGTLIALPFFPLGLPFDKPDPDEDEDESGDGR